MSDRSVRLQLLQEKTTGNSVGITWGIPWGKGVLDRKESLVLTSHARELAMQSWPTAYWPDGSVKWTAHSTVLSDEDRRDLSVSIGKPAVKKLNLSVTESKDSILIHTGVAECVIARQGNSIIRSITRNGHRVGSDVMLMGLREERKTDTAGNRVWNEPFESNIHSSVVEQNGPIRAVIRVDGFHRSKNGEREWLPFTLRIYLYAGLETIRLVHTFHYDGDPNKDFIKAIGITLQVPLDGPLYNRHVRIAGDTGFFGESPKTLHTRRTKGKYRELFERQSEGKPVEFNANDDGYFMGLLEDSATWDDYKLVQDSSHHYRIMKRTKEDCSWLKVTDGHRSSGLGYVGGVNGGIGIGDRYFWEKHPRAIEVSNTTGAEASLTLWLWSPDVPAMDLRHYDSETHVESSYEGFNEMNATPYGIANTNELTLWALPETPGPERLEEMQAELREPSLLVCEPEYYYSVRALGLWSLPDQSTPAKIYMEEQLDGILSFYLREIEQRGWYGFWDYGDVMHSYDPVRHVWNYDLGGCAWQNAELVPNMWLWTMFLRSGRADIFRMAEAMTRHTSEVDTYHFGKYIGLGSRHNVVHWGCGCKEARIFMAGLHRYYYYLTADERIGDLLDLVKDADYSTLVMDPMRAYFPKDENPVHLRIGPDWAAFCSNWMTRWERFEDTLYRDKILTGIQCLKNAKYRMLSGPSYGYNPETSALIPMGEDNSGRHMVICMGGPQVWFELGDMLEDPEWMDMLAEFGVYYNLPQNEKDLITNGEIKTESWGHPVLSAGIAAFGAYHKRDKATAEKCWEILLLNPFGHTNLSENENLVTYMEDLFEIDWINTNEASQWSLNAILSLELLSEYLEAVYRRTRIAL
ncbi:hypothetical protein [Paenibacillus sp. HB172176]|uniref:exo-rhamnogalacturonan lyase family protein n=1 Tax=Paenibacillus sp. HB172176 TaxID=2493690 RepID=UPI001439AC69|nr:hypothetical protein [Paenibacillus sp. HB172176]